MAAYRVQVLDNSGELIVGATLNCADDVLAKDKFDSLPLPPGRAELWHGDRLVMRRAAEDAA